MQNKKTHLLCALICLSVTFPMLSGCRFTGGPVYKTSSYHFYNPFASKHKDYDDLAMAGTYDDHYGLPKQEVATPVGGYLNDSARETRTATNNRGRSGSDPMNDLHHAGLAQNSGTAGSTGIATSKPKPADSMFPPAGTLTASNQTQQFSEYGTTTPIDPGFGGTNSGQSPAQQSPAQQSLAQQSLNPNPSFPANSGMPSNGQPGFDPFGRQMIAGQSSPQSPMQSPMQSQAGFPGQPGNMTDSFSGHSQHPYLNVAADPVFGGHPNAGTPGTPVSPQMVAMNGYGGQPVNHHDAAFSNPMQGHPAQPVVFPGTGALSPQNAAMPGVDPNANFGQQAMLMPNGPMPNGPMIHDPGYGAMTGYGDPANSGMTNPAATGATAFPAFDPSQATMQTFPQGTPMQTYPGQPNTAQQPVNNGYQYGFNVFGSPADGNEYRPGSTTAYGW